MELFIHHPFSPSLWPSCSFFLTQLVIWLVRRWISLYFYYVYLQNADIVKLHFHISTSDKNQETRKKRFWKLYDNSAVIYYRIKSILVALALVCVALLVSVHIHEYKFNNKLVKCERRKVLYKYLPQNKLLIKLWFIIIIISVH